MLGQLLLWFDHVVPKRQGSNDHSGSTSSYFGIRSSWKRNGPTDPVFSGVRCFFHSDTNKDSCYSFIGTERSWLNARATCKSLGGHLAAFETLEEYQFIANEASLLDNESHGSEQLQNLICSVFSVIYGQNVIGGLGAQI